MRLRERPSELRAKMIESPGASSDEEELGEGQAPPAAAPAFSDDEEEDGRQGEGEEGGGEGAGAADSDASDLFDPDNDAPYVRRKGDTRRRDVHKRPRKQGRWKRPQIFDLVLSTLGRADLFDADSLKALRRVSKSFLHLVDSTTGAVAAANFKVSTRGRCEALEAWAQGGRWTNGTAALSVAGKLPPALAGRVMVALCTLRPPIQRLELDGVGVAGEVLLAAPLDQLQELSLQGSHKKSSLLKDLVAYPAFAGLRSLAIGAAPTGDAATLAAVLTHFSELRALSLSDTDVKGTALEGGALANALPLLESLELRNGGGVIAKTGLLGAGGPLLPALRTFKLLQLRGLVQTRLEARPWLGRIKELRLSGVSLAGPGVAAALNGGPLEALHLGQDNNVAYQHWDWRGLEFPSLRRLELGGQGADVLGDVGRAKMPELRAAVLPLNSNTGGESVRALAAAFPLLRELTLGSGTPSVAVVEALGRDLLPHLESFEWTARTADAAAFAHDFFPAGPADGAPRWPRLRDLNLTLDRANWNSDIHFQEFLVALTRASSHCPGLGALRAVAGNGADTAAAEAFLAAAREVRAWPLLRNLGLALRGQEKGIIIEKMKEIWPKATVGEVVRGPHY